MPIHAEKNLYPGINAHLNSYLQNTWGEWESFHSAFIVLLAHHLDAVLPVGYFARVEKGLQIREESVLRRPRPDVTIFGKPASPTITANAVAPTLTSPVIETMDMIEVEYLNAAGIYQETEMGKPVTRIELFSPTNKPPSEGYWQYRDKRNSALKSGVALVEIDFLHQTPSPIRNIPSYPDRQPNAQPYNITVSDPRPTVDEGLSDTYSFHVDAPLPPIEIPLASQDRIAFNLLEAYNDVFASTRFYQAIVDYEQKPLAFQAYNPLDQERILARMSVIQTAHSQP